MTLLTCEAEYIALTEADEMSMFLALLFKYIGSGVDTPAINCDNNSAINLAKHPTNHRDSNTSPLKTTLLETCSTQPLF